MNYNTLLLDEKDEILEIKFNRIENKNSINTELLQELNSILDYAEQNPYNKMIVLKGNSRFFCTGMDLSEYTELVNHTAQKVNQPELYMQTIKRLSTISRLIVSQVEGQVMAGGMGIIAASDYVIGTHNVRFSLSEALWGLLPAMVLPYLVRRVGYQKAYAMTLTTQTIDAEEAYKNHLIDCLSDNTGQALQRFWLRARLVRTPLIGQMKAYFRSLWIINEQMEQEAVRTITTLMQEPQTKENIMEFVKYKKLPWE